MLALPIVFAVPVQLLMVRVNVAALRLAKLRAPTVPVPKSMVDPVAVRVRAPSPRVLVPAEPAVPSLKFPLANVPPPNDIVALLLI